MSDKLKQILIVDDVKEILIGISGVLELEGFDVVKAENGLQALELINDQTDLVVSDILMPEMDGIELCQEIKKSYPELPVILISGGGRQPTVNTGYDYLESAKRLTGVNTILKKPFDPEELINQINEKLL